MMKELKELKKSLHPPVALFLAPSLITGEAAPPAAGGTV